ncbi:small multi-drug export protein [Methanoculleus sp.]|uniref:small multi-drug export protein n=1 Tax=Methanoculleus sp. TaxID=90427 RepID=UPI0025EE383A|nr:small multi-drug export protein [Methanoculleus sp.]
MPALQERPERDVPRRSDGATGRSRVIDGIRRGFRAIAIAFVVATLVPVVLGLLLSVPTGRVLSLIVATLLLQANAAFVGMGLGLHPVFVLVVMTFVEVGIVLSIYEILDAFAEQSERVKRFTKSTEAKMARYPILQRYGAVTLIVLPALPVIGLYSSVVIGWLLRWDKLQSVFFVTLGWVLVTGFLLLVALGIVRVVF